MPEITIGRLKGGFCVKWDDPTTGKRRRYRLEARTRQEAEAEGVAVYKTQTYNPNPHAKTARDFWDAYVISLGTKPTATTMRHTGKAILPHFGAFAPSDITDNLCKDYHTKRKDAGISQGSVWTELGHLQSALNHGLQRKAPKLWRPAKPASDKRILDRGEAAALIDAATAPHIRLAIILLLGTAGRVSAILDLTWDRVNFEQNAINLRLPDTATRKGRANVPMNAMTRAALSVAYEAALSDYVVEYGTDRVKSIRRGFQNAVGRAKLGHVRIHDIRHTAAVTMLAAGIPIEKVAQYLGHSNTSVTFNTYGRYLPSHMADAAEVLDFTAIRKVE